MVNVEVCLSVLLPPKVGKRFLKDQPRILERDNKCFFVLGFCDGMDVTSGKV